MQPERYNGSKYADVFAYRDVSTPHEGTSPRTCLVAGGSEGLLKLQSLSGAVVHRIKWSGHRLPNHAVATGSTRGLAEVHEQQTRALMRHEGEPILAH